MEKLKAWSTPLIILAILVGSGLATILLPTITSSFAGLGGGGEGGELSIPAPETVEIDIDGYFYTVNETVRNLVPDFATGEQSSLIVLLVLTVVVIGGMVVFTGLIYALFTFGNRATVNLKQSQAYQERVAAMQQKEKEALKERNQAAPTKMPKDRTMPRWSVLSTSLLILLLSYFGGLVLGVGLSPDSPNIWANLATLAALLYIIIYLRPDKVLRPNIEAAQENVPQVLLNDEPGSGSIPWGTIFVVLSGAIMLGIGIGLMVAVINTPADSTTFEFFTTLFESGG